MTMHYTSIVLTISSIPAALGFTFVVFMLSSDLSSLSTIAPLRNEKSGPCDVQGRRGGTYFGLSGGLRSSSRSMSIIESSVRLSETAGDTRILLITQL